METSMSDLTSCETVTKLTRLSFDVCNLAIYNMHDILPPLQLGHHWLRVNGEYTCTSFHLFNLYTCLFVTEYMYLLFVLHIYFFLVPICC